MKKIVLLIFLSISSLFAKVTIDDFLDPQSFKEQWVSEEWISSDMCSNSLASYQRKEAMFMGMAKGFANMNGNISKGTKIFNHTGGTSFNTNYETFLWNFSNLVCRLSDEEFQNLSVIMYFRILKNDWKKPFVRRMTQAEKNKVREITMLHFVSNYKLTASNFFNFYVFYYNSLSGEIYRESDQFAKAVFQGNIGKAKKILHSEKVENYLDWLYGGES